MVPHATFSSQNRPHRTWQMFKWFLLGALKHHHSADVCVCVHQTGSTKPPLPQWCVSEHRPSRFYLNPLSFTHPCPPPPHTQYFYWLFGDFPVSTPSHSLLSPPLHPCYPHPARKTESTLCYLLSHWCGQTPSGLPPVWWAGSLCSWTPAGRHLLWKATPSIPQPFSRIPWEQELQASTWLLASAQIRDRVPMSVVHAVAPSLWPQMHPGPCPAHGLCWWQFAFSQNSSMSSRLSSPMPTLTSHHLQNFTYQNKKKKG